MNNKLFFGALGFFAGLLSFAVIAAITAPDELITVIQINRIVATASLMIGGAILWAGSRD